MLRSGMESLETLPKGLTSLDLPLGEVRVRVIDLPTTWEPFVSRYYEPFAEPVEDRQAADLTIVCRTGSGIVVPLPEPGGLTEIDLSQEGEGVYRIRSHWQDGRIDLGTGEGEITFTDLREIQLRMSLENFLRVAGQLLLTTRSSFLVHSAGVLEDERCYLFFGHSGAGKSTVTEVSAPRPALSDDIVLIHTAGPEPMAHAVPFFGAFPIRQRVRGAFPVAGAFRLRQDQEDRLQPISRARAVATLAASVPFVQDLGLRHDRLTDLVTEFCGKVPVYDLHFTRSDHFWQLIHEELQP